MYAEPISVDRPLPRYLRRLEREYDLEPNSLDGLGPEAILVHIARVSSERKNKVEKPENLIGYLMEHYHWSPFEMANLKVEIVTTRGIAHQILRHRSFSFQEFSQRYATAMPIPPMEMRLQAEKNRQSSTDLVGVVGPGFMTYVADMTEEQEEALMLAAGALEDARDAYDKLVEVGFARECARGVLPIGTGTKLYMNGTLRSWLHFIHVRDDEHAQKEVQMLAREIKGHIKELFPLLYAAAEKHLWSVPFDPQDDDQVKAVKDDA